MTIEVFDPGLKYYVKRIRTGIPFTQIRYGDGEWSSILQDRGRTSSGSQALNIIKLKKQMARSIIMAPNADNYIASIRPGSQRLGIGTWLEVNKPDYLRFHDCRVLYKASKKGQLYPWVRAIREGGLPVIIVGPKRHKTLHKRMFEIARHVVIPNKDCFIQQDRIMQEVIDFQQPAFVLFSAGPAAKVMCWQLWHRIGRTSFLFDVGSLLDIYCIPPKKSRQYHKYLLNRPHLIKRNLTGNDEQF